MANPFRWQWPCNLVSYARAVDAFLILNYDLSAGAVLAL